MDLKALRSRLAKEGDELSNVVAACRGVTPAEAMASEVLPLLDGIQWLEREATRILAPRRESTRGRPQWMSGLDVEVRRVPLGRVLILGPGNYPLFLPGIQALQALVAGNHVLLKPQVGCEEPLRRLAALLPAERLELLPSSPLAAQQAIAAGVDLVVLTGSAETGRAVMALCAEHVTPLIAELSGSDAIVVGPGADLALVARAAAWGRQLNGGNTCVAPRRLVCLASDAAPLRASCPEMEIREARDLEHLIELTNDSPYGLGASLFGEVAWAREASRSLKVGFVTVNDLIVPTADPRLPFGGRKRSGFGTTRGAEGLLQMTAPQAISVRTGGPLYHLDPPSPHDQAILSRYARFAHGQGPGRFLHLGGLLVAVLKERWRRKRS